MFIITLLLSSIKRVQYNQKHCFSAQKVKAEIWTSTSRNLLLCSSLHCCPLHCNAGTETYIGGTFCSRNMINKESVSSRSSHLKRPVSKLITDHWKALNYIRLVCNVVKSTTNARKKASNIWAADPNSDRHIIKSTARKKAANIWAAKSSKEQLRDPKCITAIHCCPFPLQVYCTGLHW